MIYTVSREVRDNSLRMIRFSTFRCMTFFWRSILFSLASRRFMPVSL